MPYDLKGRNVLVTGGSRGLGAVICEVFAKEGANVAVNYFNRSEAAYEVAGKCEKEYGVKACVVKGDAGVTADCRRCVEETIKELGGIDVVIANAGWTKFSKFEDLDALTEDEWDKCWNTNVKGQLALLKAALPTFQANPEGGSYIITSSIAGVTQGGSSMAYAVTKAAQLQLMKCLASTQGPKVRINAVLPGFLPTEWGYRYAPEVIQAVKDKAALKHETHLIDCANAFVMLAKNTSITGIKVQVDAGLAIQTP